MKPKRKRAPAGDRARAQEKTTLEGNIIPFPRKSETCVSRASDCPAKPAHGEPLHDRPETGLGATTPGDDLNRKAFAIARARIAAGVSTSGHWLIGELRRRYGADLPGARAAVAHVFGLFDPIALEARAASLSAHAAELRRYVAERARKRANPEE